MEKVFGFFLSIGNTCSRLPSLIPKVPTVRIIMEHKVGIKSECKNNSFKN